jgi:hypothetical protein
MFPNNKRSNTALLKALEAEAEENFSNVIGDENYDENYEEGYDENYEEGYDDYDEYDEYDGMNPSSLDVSEKVLTITVTNSNAAASKAKVFGSFKNSGLPNFGSDTGVLVVCNESSYAQVLRETESNPMQIKGIKMFVNSAAQFANTLTFAKQESTGSINSQPLQPSNYISAVQLNATIAEMKGISFPIDGKTELAFDINAGEKVTFVFSVKAKVDISKASQGKSVVAVSRTKRMPRRRGAGRRR